MGDVTITANRSKYVDFTQPYTESGVRMIVPVKTDNRKNALIFLKPLTLELWVTSGAFFLFTGVVVWFLEHRISPDFSGSLSQQLGVIFWFSFSTMVFAHKEKLISNLSKFVVIIWLFVVLILTSSYTASLTSMLTVQKLQPTVTDFNSLIKNRDYVGYFEGSFVKELLMDMKFEKSKLKPFRSSEECADLLSKGSGNGGVAAIFNELPYNELFLSKYCNNYTMAGPSLKTAGFGFVFPKGSPLVSDFSRAILNVAQGNQMVLIKRAWFGHETTCPDPETTLNSNALSLSSFWCLFLITGMASLSAFIIYLAIFLYNNRHILITGNMGVRQRIIALAKKFDQKDISSNTFQNTELRERMGNDIIASDTAYDTSNRESPLRSLNNHEAGRNIIPNGEGTSPTACSSPRNSVLADEIYVKDGHD